MKEVLKQEKGISLISLVITVIIIVSITGMIIYNSHTSIYVKNLTSMYNDIETLRDKISEYYSKYGTIPANQKYTNTENLKEAKGANDVGDFYVIDLSALDGLILNYGKDYERVKYMGEQDEINKGTDLYIINYNSHNIFYVRGVEYEIDGRSEIYYTDENEPDTQKVQLRYVSGIRIPNNAEYIGGDKYSKLTIKVDGINYIWKVLDEEIKSADEYTIDEAEKQNFIKSANAYEGFYVEDVTNKPKVIYLPLNEENNWIYYYKEEGIYKDDNKEEAYIPAKCYVSRTPNINKINQGLVIKDEGGNEYVWIPVPKDITKDAKTEDEIEQALIEYTEDYNKEGYSDTWYDDTCGLTKEEYENKKNTMLRSIKQNGGFYIGRYEAGLDNPKISGSSSQTVSTLISENGLPLSQRDKYPYNFVTCAQAEQLAEKVNIEGKTSSLMFGIQWKLVCKFISTMENKTEEQILKDSAEWGNYNNSQFIVSRGKYTTDASVESLWKPASISNTYLKTSSPVLLTTGITDRNMALNIYDLAGNVGEWLLESNGTGKQTIGGNTAWEQENSTLATRDSISNSEIGADGRYGFRITIY